MYKDIPFTNGYYSCDEEGNVRSNTRVVMRSNGCKQTIRERILKAKTNNQGYYYVSLCCNGEIKAYLVHRLVAITFLDNPNNLSTVNHKDGNPKNNRVENLEWLSMGDNNKHSYQVLGRAPAGGRAVVMLDCDKQILQTFPTQSAASIFLVGNNSLRGPIGKACKTKKQYHGYYWRYQ